LPPFFGFIGKELIYKAGVKLEGIELLFLVAAFVGNLLMMGLALKAGVGPFIGKPNLEALPKKPHEAPISMWIGPVVLSVAGLILGIFPMLITDALVAPAITAVKGAPIKHLDLALWHLVKPSLPLLLSCITILGGTVVFIFRKKFWDVADPVLAAIRPYGAEAMYERIFNGVVGFSKWQTRRLQTGRLHDYVFMIVAATVGFLLWAILGYEGIRFNIDGPALSPLMLGLVIVMVVATLCVVTSNDFITVLVGLGTIGFGVALIFMYFGAPDLAITQLLVETLTVVLFMFVIFRLPALKRYSGRAHRVRDAILACTFGGVMTVLVLKAISIQFARPISEHLTEISYLEAKGRNVVNVILVDFRALDTFGEISVVMAAALGIAALASGGLLKRKGTK